MKRKLFFALSSLAFLGCQTSSNKDLYSVYDGKTYPNYSVYIPKKIETSQVKNIILMIGDGMGATQISAAITANRGKIHLNYMTHYGFSKTSSSDNYITDSAAGATAFSIGKKTKNGAIGLDANNKAHQTILERAKEKGMATGLVATSEITHATPASFAAHQTSRKMHQAIAKDMSRGVVDVMLGGGKTHFEKRKDGQNLLKKMETEGYLVVDETVNLDSVSHPKLVALFAEEGLPKWKERKHSLSQLSQTALRLLDQNEQGFFLMIEGSQIDWGGHANDLEYVVTEALDFDQTIGEVLKFAEQDGETLVIVTADHETGGLSLLGGDVLTGEVKGHFSTGRHSATMVPVYSYGPSSEMFSGIYENTAIYDKMKAIMER